MRIEVRRARRRAARRPGRWVASWAAKWAAVVGGLWLFFACACVTGCGGAEKKAVDTGARSKKKSGPEISEEERLRRLYAKIAESYYAVARPVLAQERAALKARPASPDSERVVLRRGRVAGAVVDRANVVVPKTDIMVTTESADEVIGRGRADQAGRFNVELTASVYRTLTLHAVAKGYDKWMLERIEDNPAQWRIRLDQKLDRTFLETLTQTVDPEARLWMLLEIVGARRFPLKVETVFPYLGYLRAELFRILRVRAFYERDDALASPAERALELLAFWGEPSDVKVVRERLPKSGYTIFKKPVFVGGSPGEVCGMWGDAYLAQLDLDPRPPSSCGRPYFSTDRDRAIITFTFADEYASYSQLLSVADHGRGWELVLVKELEKKGVR